MYQYKKSPQPNGVFLLIVLISVGVAIPAAWWVATMVVALGWADHGMAGALKFVAIPTVIIGYSTFKILEFLAFKIGLSPYTMPK